MKSLRSRLILWNTAVLTLALIAVGGTIAWLNLSRMAQGIDRELADRARNLGRAPVGPGLRAPPAANREGIRGAPALPGSEDGVGAPGSQVPIREQGAPQPPFMPPGQGRAGPGLPPFLDPAAERIASIRRPRVLDPGGREPFEPQPAGPFDPKAIALARAGRSVYSYADLQGEPVRVLTTPAPRFGQGWVVQVARETRDYRELARVQWLTLLTVLPFGVGLAALGGRFLTARAMRPIARMGEVAAQIGSGQFDRRIETMGKDEFAELGHRLNEMAESLGASFKEREAAYESLRQAYEQQRRFVADASHELRTPLTRLRLATSSALSDESSDARAALRVADDSAGAMSKLVSQLLELARSDSGELRPSLRPADLRAVAADAIAAMPPDGAPIRLVAVHTETLSDVDRGQIERALANLLDNARRHSPPDREILVEVEAGIISVVDRGEGVSPEHLPHLRERFYRADQSRGGDVGGAGLGLAIVDEIMRAHGGSLEIESELGKGTRATLRFAQKPQNQTNS